MPRKSRKNVGLIGLGIIGSRVAAGLRAAGFHVFVWNRTAKPAPNFVGSPAELAELCEIIQLFVADAQALFDVVEQMKDVLTPQHVIVCNATVGPEATIEAARMVEETGAHFLDAPFTGSKAASEKRALVYYIGGDEATFLRARPVLEATSKAIVRIGGVGHAATIKVVTNMIAAVSIQTLGEALAIVQKAGLDPEVLAAALEQNACRSATMEMKLPKMIAGDYDPHFSLKHMFKDVQLGIHVANALDIEIPATTVTAGVMYGALNQGWGDLDFSALYKIYDPQSADAPLGELHGGMVQLEDLDPREVHYPETTVPAPPRPTAEAASSSEPAEIVAENLATLVEGNGELAAKTALPAIEAAPPPSSELVLAPIAPEPHAGSVVLNVPAPEPAHENNAAPLALKPVEIVPAPASEIEKSATLNPPEVATPNAVTESQPDHVLNSAIRVVDAPTSPAPAHLAASPAAEQNGGAAVVPNRAFPDEATSAQKPFNFVKRWFVARTGS